MQLFRNIVEILLHTAPDDLPHYPSLYLGITFETLKEAKNTIPDAIAKANESFKVKNAEPVTFWALECRGREAHKCDFSLRVSLKGKPIKEWTLAIMRKHTCSTQCHDGWQRVYYTNCLARQRFNLVASNRKIPLEFVQDEARLKQGGKISSRQAHRTVVAVRRLIEGDKSKQFQFMKSFLIAIRDSNMRDHMFECEECPGELEWEKLYDTYDGATVKYRSEGGVFQTAVIMSSACTLALFKCRKHLIFDGTHCFSKYGAIPLIVSTVDADEANIVLAWIIVPTESRDWWEWFLEVILENVTMFGRDRTAGPRKFATAEIDFS